MDAIATRSWSPSEGLQSSAACGANTVRVKVYKHGAGGNLIGSYHGRPVIPTFTFGVESKMGRLDRRQGQGRDMAAAPIVVPGASSCVVEPRFIRDCEMARPIAFLVENRRVRRNGPTTTATSTNSQQRHGNVLLKQALRPRTTSGMDKLNDKRPTERPILRSHS